MVETPDKITLPGLAGNGWRTVKIFELASLSEITPPIRPHASACFPPHHPPYSASRGAANAEGSGDGLETPTGVYHRDGRSGITAAERVPGDGKSYPAQPDSGPRAPQRWRAPSFG